MSALRICSVCQEPYLKDQKTCNLCGCHVTNYGFHCKDPRGYYSFTPLPICISCGATENLEEKLIVHQFADQNGPTLTTYTVRWSYKVCKDCLQIKERIEKVDITADPELVKARNQVRLYYAGGIALAVLVSIILILVTPAPYQVWIGIFSFLILPLGTAILISQFGSVKKGSEMVHKAKAEKIKKIIQDLKPAYNHFDVPFNSIFTVCNPDYAQLFARTNSDVFSLRTIDGEVVE